MTATDRATGPVAQVRRAVGASFLVNGTVMGSWAPYVPLVKQRLELSDAVLGLGLLAMGAGALVAMMFASVLLDRCGSARVVRFSGFVLCVWLPAPVLAPDFASLVVALTIFGAVMGTMDVAMNAQAVAVESEYERPVMSSFHGMWSVGGLAGAAFGGFALTAWPHWLHLAVVCAATMALAAWSFRHLLAGGEAGPGPLQFSLPGGAAVVLGVLTFLSMMSEGAVLDWSAVFLSESRAADTAMAAAAFAAFSGTMAAGRFFGDTVRARYSALALARSSGGIAAAGFMIAILSPQPLLAIGGFAIAGLGIANMVPVFFSAAGAVPSGAPARNLAAVATIGYTGFLVGPVLIGFLSAQTGLQTALLVLPVFMLVIVIFAGAVRAGHAGGKP